MSRLRPAAEAPGSGNFKYFMAGGIVLAALLLVVATRKEPPPPAPPTTTGPRPPVVRQQVPRPPHLEEIQRLTAQFAANPEAPAGRDALFARAKIYAEHKDYRSASEDLRRLHFRRDVSAEMRQQVEGLLRTVELERRKTGR